MQSSLTLLPRALIIAHSRLPVLVPFPGPAEVLARGARRARTSRGGTSREDCCSVSFGLPGNLREDIELRTVSYVDRDPRADSRTLTVSLRPARRGELRGAWSTTTLHNRGNALEANARPVAMTAARCAKIP